MRVQICVGHQRSDHAVDPGSPIGVFDTMRGVPLRWPDVDHRIELDESIAAFIRIEDDHARFVLPRPVGKRRGFVVVVGRSAPIATTPRSMRATEST